MTDHLADRECVPCKAGAAPLTGPALARLLGELGGGWQVVDAHHLEKIYKFRNFREALNFTNRIGEIAESQGHHPDIHLAWGSVKVQVWTHKIGGLTESDFIYAAKVERSAGDYDGRKEN